MNIEEAIDQVQASAISCNEAVRELQVSGNEHNIAKACEIQTHVAAILKLYRELDVENIDKESQSLN